MMEPEDVTGQILKTLFESTKSLDDQIAATKKTLEEKDAELLEAKTQIEVVKEKKQESQKLLETAQALVAAIPEYKQRIENLKAAEEAGKIKLGKACEELNDLQMKQMKMERLSQYYETKLKEMGDELAALEQELPPPSSRLPSLPQMASMRWL